MSDTTFVARVTKVLASWLNDVNAMTYKNVINVKFPAYGAVGNGVVDDTAAIQAAINAVPISSGGTTGQGGYTIYFPPGKYKLTAALVVGSRRISFLGNPKIGSNGTVLINTTNPNVNFIDYTTGSIDTCSVEGLQFLGAGKASGTGNAVIFGQAGQTAFDSIIKDCWFSSIPNACVYLKYAADYQIISCGIENSVIGVFIENIGIASGDINSIVNCTFYSCTSGVLVQDGTDLLISSNQFNLCGTNPGGTGDDTHGAIVLSKTGPIAIRGTLISSNIFRANTNDINLQGNGGVYTSNSGISDTTIVANASDRGYRRFVLCNGANGTRIMSNSVGTCNQETAGTFDAIELAGTADLTYLSGNSVKNAVGSTFRPPYGLTLGATTTNTILGTNDFLGKTGTVNLVAGATLLTPTDVAPLSADQGNAGATLTAGASPVTNLWATPISVDRAVTLSTVNAYEGAKFRIVRQASATGAFNLNVGTGPLKAMATPGSFCDVEFHGTAWTLTAYGVL